MFSHQLPRLGLICVVLSISTIRSPAFEGYEHKALGNIALETNLRWIRTLADSERKTTALARLEFLAGTNGGWHGKDSNTNAVTYGDVVRLVDYMKDNYRLLHGPDSGSDWPAEPDDTTATYLHDLNGGLGFIAWAHASHSNQDHFQGRAFFAFWFWHQQAVAAAARTNLWGALLINAYADHFLQDSFAPGHITGPRDENSHDLPSILIHDSYNENGMEYVVRQPSDLRPALEMMTSGTRHGINLPDHIITSLKMAQGPIAKRFYGDSLINRTPEQPVIMTAYCVQSLRDVVESYLSGKEMNSFRDYSWNIHFTRSKDGPLEKIYVVQKFGDLTCVENVLSEKVFKSEKDMESFEGSPGSVALSLRKGAKLSAVGASFGIHSHMNKQSSHVSFLLDLEYLIRGDRWDIYRDDDPKMGYHWWQPDQYGITLGYSGVYGSHTTAHGPMVRVIFPVSRINLQWSVLAGVRYHARGNDDGWADFESLRLEWGMHMANVFFGVGRDSHFHDQRLRNGVTIDAGISFAVPISRIQRLFR